MDLALSLTHSMQHPPRTSDSATHTEAMNDYDAVVVGGRGAVGSLVAGLLADDGLSVLAVDREPVSPSSSKFHQCVGDGLDPDHMLRHTLKSAEIVVLAVPEAVALSWSPVLVGANALVVETLSVKSGFAAKVAASSTSTAVLGINPMFAPALGMAGRPVAAVTHQPGDRVEEFLDRITRWGGRVVRMDADQHDRVAAATQALTHASVLAFGSALASLDVDPRLVEAVAPPPTRIMLALLARISGGEPEVYWDVQSGNPYARTARASWAEAVRDVESAITSGSESNFTALMERAGSPLPNAEKYRELCGRLFGIVKEPACEGDRS